MDGRCIWIMFCLCCVCVRGEVYTALIEMENLVYREKGMVAAVKDYLKEEEARLERIREFTRKLDKIHAVIPHGKVESYLGHPTNAYLLIRRFVEEWPALENMAKNPSFHELDVVLNQHRSWFPEQSDLKGAIAAIFRVQEIFNIKSLALSNDLLPSDTRAYPMEAGDAFTLGKGGYKEEKFKFARKWLQVAFVLWKEGRRSEGDDVVEILDYLSFVEYKLGNLRKAYNLTLEMLMHDPTHERAQKNLKYYAGELKKSGLLSGKRDAVKVDDALDDDDEVETNEDENWKGSGAYRRYSKICRSDVDAMHNYTLHEQRQLKCWFHKKHVWLYMRGIGVERIHITPEVIYFRNVVTDHEIDVIKRLGQPKLRRAVIQHPVTGNLEPADYRISKSGWLKDEEDPIIKRISTRMEYLTGLTFSTAEELQVNTYGMGGHYEPHYDHAQDHEDKFSDLGSGNRIATMLLYMSDVELGGGTAFVNVGALVVPRKGDSVFWYNLFRNGNGNDDTRHAACPVLVGTKWVANKWIHEKGQEFRRKCSLRQWE